jgi:subtilisin-like proprotein convertase family protein
MIGAEGAGATSPSVWIPRRHLRARRWVGGQLAGSWILRVSDHEAADVGTLQEWSLDVTYVG